MEPCSPNREVPSSSPDLGGGFLPRPHATRHSRRLQVSGLSGFRQPVGVKARGRASARTLVDQEGENVTCAVALIPGEVYRLLTLSRRIAFSLRALNASGTHGNASSSRSVALEI